jgi:putative ABC transport system ATP-binding protein
MSIVQVENVSKDYLLGKTILHALKGINLSIAQGEFLAIAGPSGSGKTTLLNLIGCIDKPSSGRILIDGIDVTPLSGNSLAEIRAEKLSFIFQNFNLLPVLTAQENVEYPLLYQKISTAEKKSLALKALDSVGLAGSVRHKPMELSGGQQQRVAIARALVRRPLIILADEPTANLDHATAEEILDLMKRFNKEYKTTFIFSTHDQKIMDRADRVVKIWDGELQC